MFGAPRGGTPPPPSSMSAGPPPELPIDDNIYILMIFGLVYGIYIFNKKKTINKAS